MMLCLSQKGYNLANGGADVAGGAGGPAGGAGGMSPQKRTFISPTIEGDQRHLFGQGRPMAKDSSGSGSAWATGTVSRYTGASGYNVESRLMFEGTVAATDMSRATDAREKLRIGIFGSGLSYAGSYGRVTSESIGRDLNPLGRGAGQALVGGMQQLGMLEPSMPRSMAGGGVGNSVNNAPWTECRTYRPNGENQPLNGDCCVKCCKHTGFSNEATREAENECEKVVLDAKDPYTNSDDVTKICCFNCYSWEPQFQAENHITVVRDEATKKKCKGCGSMTRRLAKKVCNNGTTLPGETVDTDSISIDRYIKFTCEVSNGDKQCQAYLDNGGIPEIVKKIRKRLEKRMKTQQIDCEWPGSPGDAINDPFSNSISTGITTLVKSCNSSTTSNPATGVMRSSIISTSEFTQHRASILFNGCS